MTQKIRHLLCMTLRKHIFFRTYLSHDEHCDNSVPISWSQFASVINNPIGHSQTSFLPSGNQKFRFTFSNPLHFFIGHKSQILQDFLSIVHGNKGLRCRRNNNNRGSGCTFSSTVWSVVRGNWWGDAFCQCSIGVFSVRLRLRLFVSRLTCKVNKTN